MTSERNKTIMIDISKKDPTAREAISEGKVLLSREAIRAIRTKMVPKGDVLEAARLAGILAAKKTPSLIPLCHPIGIEYVGIDFSISKKGVKIITTVRSHSKTGVEMEALTAAAVSALTIYDMCKPIDKEIEISDIRLVKKSGGKSGTYVRNSKSKNQNSK